MNKILKKDFLEIVKKNKAINKLKYEDKSLFIKIIEAYVKEDKLISINLFGYDRKINDSVIREFNIVSLLKLNYKPVALVDFVADDYGKNLEQIINLGFSSNDWTGIWLSGISSNEIDDWEKTKK